MNNSNNTLLNSPYELFRRTWQCPRKTAAKELEGIPQTFVTFSRGCGLSPSFACSTHSSISERNKGLHEVLKAARYWSPSYKTMEASINCQRLNSNQNRKRLCYWVLRAVLSVTPLSQAARDTCFVNGIFCWQVRAYNQKAAILEGLGQNNDALHQLHLSLECLPGDVSLFQFQDWHLSLPYW